MAKDVNLNSSEWIDMIFEGKNKKYGAYFLRSTSSKRHIVAFIIIVFFVGMVAAIPSLMEAVKSNDKDDLAGVDEAYELSNLSNVEEQVPEENIIRQETAPPPPPLKATVQFTPPVITDDDKVTDENQMKSQDELNESKVQISIASVEGSDDKDAVDIADLKDHKVIVEQTEPEKPFVSVEQMPQFPGGQAELMKFISNNLKYPTIAAENGIEGRVIIRFVVSANGSVQNIEIQRGLDSSCDKEAVRVVKMMPKWIAGKQNGRAVPVYFTLPVLFKLQK
ncbi:energy transducer TonB [Dysgonomonas sp. 216]|uniref:energy transducer TonB n=1 Tax=Dysgonomonas sp. 216 TaxID=2302934 RepID=UPI0013D1D84C|nr:energy transducer TonB [Dysgonomonas sp. 216]NDW17948.1 energy transducer TonB [Dysgonomonas sp. 216]